MIIILAFSRIFFVSIIYHSCIIDASSNRKLLSKLFNLRGIVTQDAKDGLEAVEIVKAMPNNFDVIFMDNTMPVMVR